MSYEEDEERERFLEMLDYMAARYEEETLTASAALLAAMPAATDVPMPLTAHPALERHAEVVRSFDARRGHVRLPKPRPMVAFEKDEATAPSSVALDVMTLTASKVAGPAPFVGDARREAAMYVWCAWTDEVGRCITTDAELIWR